MSLGCSLSVTLLLIAGFIGLKQIERLIGFSPSFPHLHYHEGSLGRLSGAVFSALEYTGLHFLPLLVFSHETS